MKIKLILTFSILTFFLLSLVTPSFAQNVVPGVANGDIFEYSYAVTWSSTQNGGVVPDYIIELNKTQSFQIRITEVSGTTINAEVITRYRDGTTNTETGFVDVQSGSIRLTFGYLIIAGNLNVSDKIYPSGGEATINSTQTRTYSSGNRQTNKYIVEATYDNSYEKKEFYFDKQKGIAVDYYFESRETVGSYTEDFTETITNTNSDVWTAIPEPSKTESGFEVYLGVVAVVLVLVGSTALLLYKRKVRRRR